MNSLESKVQLQTAALSTRIDFLRGVFAVWVLIAHSFEFSVRLSTNPFWTGLPGIWLSKLLHSGYIGVIGFFFLSGFCIHWSIEKKITSHSPQKFSFTSYLKARLWRILPLFYIGLLLAVLVQWICWNYLNRVPFIQIHEASYLNFASSIFLLQGIFGSYSTYEASWSITNEMLYYIAWPLILAIAQFKVNRGIIFAVGSALFFTSLFYVLWKIVGDQKWIVLSSLWCIPLASLMWIMGVICRSQYQTIVNNRYFQKAQRWWWLIFVGWIIWVNTLNTLNLSLFARTILDPFVYVAIPLLVLSGWKVPLSVTANRRLADLSYPLYLFHAPILILVLSLLYTALPKFPQAPAVLLASAFCLLLSGTIGVTLERFFLELRRNSQKSR